MLISETCQPSCLKLLTAHTSCPAFCSVSLPICQHTGLGRARLEGSSLSSAVSSASCLQPICLAAAPTEVLPKEPPSLFRDEEMTDSTAFPVWLGHERAYCLNFMPILGVFHLCWLWECVSLVEMSFF